LAEILPAELAKQEQYRLPGGGILLGKPEDMTHLNAQVLVMKTHPRIRFRGMVDLLESELLLCICRCPGWEEALGEVLALARRLIRCDVLEEPVPEEKLCGLAEAEMRERSHRPQDFYNQPHFMPESSDGEAMARLNRARCAARVAELKAVAAFSDREGNPTRVDILRALNRMSSMLYILMIRMEADDKHTL